MRYERYFVGMNEEVFQKYEHCLPLQEIGFEGELKEGLGWFGDVKGERIIELKRHIAPRFDVIDYTREEAVALRERLIKGYSLPPDMVGVYRAIVTIEKVEEDESEPVPEVQISQS